MLMSDILKTRFSPVFIGAVLAVTACFPAELRATLWTQTEQSEFEEGTVPVELDSALFPGDIVLNSSQSNTWTEILPLTQPSARRFHAMVYNTYDNVIMAMFGETDAVFFDDIEVFDPFNGDWSVVANPGSGPSARSRFGYAYSSYLNGIFIFGGVDSTGLALGDTWVYNITENSWTKLLPSVAPPARYGHGMAYIASQKAIILFGGTSDGSTLLSDTWVYDITYNTWTQQTPQVSPSARRDAGLVTGYNESIVLFGGVDSAGVSDETWVYNPAEIAWVQVSSATKPPATEAPALAYDSFARRVILFGGRVSGIASDQTWSFNPLDSTWQDMGATLAPDARFRHGLVYVEDTGTLFVFGGDTGSGLLNDVWEYSFKNYASSGTFVSKIIDASTPVFWTELLWSQTLMPGTGITLKVRVSDNDTLWTDWSVISASADYNGNAINQKGRYIQYQAVLSTIRPDVTPVLSSVSMDYTMDPSWRVSSSADFGQGSMSSLNPDFTAGSLVLTRDTEYGVYLTNRTNPVGAYLAKWNATAWNTSTIASLPSDSESITVGDGNNDGEAEVYALSGSYIYRMTFANSQWSADLIAVQPQPWCITVGDGNGDGENEIYIADRTDGIANIIQLKWQNSVWDKTTVAIQPKGAEWIEVADGNNDGVNEVYAFCTDNKVYQCKWSDTFWSISEVGAGYSTALNSQSFAVGDGDNDGDNEVYSITGPALYQLVKYEWNGAVWLPAVLGNLGVNGAVAVGDGDNDGDNEVFAGGSDPNDIIMFKWTGAAWNSTAISNAITAVADEIRIADGDNNTVNEVYCIDGTTNLYTLRYTGTTWLTDVNNLTGNTWYGLDVASAVDSQSSYAVSGEYLSDIFDAQSSVAWFNISWEEAEPAGTTLTMQTRSGDTPSPDTTWSEWSSPYASFTESEITSPYSRFIQFRANFSSSSADYTPSLYKVNITYTHTPGKPANELPLDTETVTTSLVTLQASDFTDTDTDEFHQASQWQARLENAAYADSGAWNSGTDESNLTGIQIPVGILMNNNVYFWRVRYRDNRNGWGEFSDETSFRYFPAQDGTGLAGNNPITPINWTPLDGTTLLTLTPQLVSSAFSDLDLDDYHTASQWQVRTNYGDYTTSIYDSGITSLNLTSITVPSGALFDGQIYYWHVRYQDNNGAWSEYSTETSFIINIAYGQDIAAGLPTMPVPLTPADGEIVTTSAHLVWQASTGNTPITYELQISLDSGFAELIESQTGMTLTDFIYSTLTNNRTYYWRIRAKNPFGTSAWTATRSFSTPSRGSGGEKGCFVKRLK